MSHRTSSPAAATIEEQEASAVALLVVLLRIAESVNGYRLLYARINWEHLYESADPPGAPTPVVARASYTRLALQQHHQRRVALRSGRAGLIAAIRAA